MELFRAVQVPSYREFALPSIFIHILFTCSMIRHFCLIVSLLFSVLTVTAQDVHLTESESIPIQNADVPLDIVNFAQQTGQDSLVIADASGRLALFIEGTYSADLGKQGEGPCEHRSVLSTDHQASWVFGLDRSQQRLLAYDLGSAQCIGQIQSSNLRRATGLASGATELFATRGQYTSQTDSDTPLFFRIHRDSSTDNALTSGEEDHSVESLSFTLDDLNPVQLPTFLNIRTPLKKHDKSVYASFPLSPKIVKYNTENDQFSSFEVDISLPTTHEVESIPQDNPQELLRMVRDDIEFIEHIQVQGDYLIIGSRRGTGPEGQWRIQFYDQNGEKYGEYVLEEKIVTITDEHIVQLVTDGDQDAVYTVVKTPYTIP